MSRSELHNWECAIEELSGDNADKMLVIAQDIYNTAFVRGKNYMSERLLDKQDWGDEDLNDYSVTVQATILVANTIKDEIARMCVAEDLAVIDALYVHAHNNLENLYRLVQEANSKRE